VSFPRLNFAYPARLAALVAAGVLLHGSSLNAQLQLGETSTKGSGTLSSGYTATYGNMIESSHGWTVGGTGNFSGSFHSPNFLSYNFSPYLNQSRANSNFQSISTASGVNLSANIFGGSKFPGSINYSKAYNSEGNYAIPGLANFVTHGNSDTFGVNWSENLEGKPSFSAGYLMGSSNYNVYGSNDNGNTAFRSVNLHSSYSWEGFNTGAFYTYGTAHALVPEIVAGQILRTRSATGVYGVNAAHRLPLQGSASASFNRSSWSNSFLGYDSTGTIDTVNGTASVHPTQDFSFSVSTNYSDNLSGQLEQSVIAAGGVIPGLNTNQSSDSFDLMAIATYSLLTSLQTSGYVERRTQTFLGKSYGVTSYGGDGVYTHRLLNGTINGAANVMANHSDQNGSDSIGFSGNESFSNVVLGWHLNESFGYAQNAQTLLVTYTNSFYTYSGNARRAWGRFNLGGGAGGSRTALTQQSGTSNSSQSYNANIGFGAIVTATGSYSKADGQALATGAGLVGIPIPAPVLPSDLVSLFGGKSYSWSLSSNPVRNLTLTAAYGKSSNNTMTNGISSANNNNQFNSLIQYQVRKLTFVSGYSRLQQGFSGAGTQPEIISSYYGGISRWFNIF
jgi:hypothetical protein